MSTEDRLIELLRSGADELAVELSSSQEQNLIAYVRLLEKWNRVFNLTGIRDPESMLIRHILDSLAVQPHLHGQRIADVGTGAGLPGVPLAISCPDRQFVLLDSRAKPVRFIRQLIGELALDNVLVQNIRVEDYRPEVRFDTVVSRALSTIAEILRLAGHLCAPGGRVLAMKGRLPAAELEELPEGWRVTSIHELSVPYLKEARQLIELRPAAVGQGHE